MNNNSDNKSTKWDKETLNQFVKLMGYDLETLVKTRKLGIVHDLVYLAESFGIKTGYKFVWYSVRQ